MRKSAAEYIRQLEGRIAHLEKTARFDVYLNILKALAIHASKMGQDINKMSSPVFFPPELQNDRPTFYDVYELDKRKWITIHNDEMDYMITSKGIDALLKDYIKIISATTLRIGV